MATSPSDSWEHREIQATCVDIDGNGDRLALAGKRILGVTKADAPGVLIAKLHRTSKWDVGNLRWSPVPYSHPKLALSSGQFFEIYSMTEDAISLESSVRCQARTVTDLDWAPSDAHRLLSCSADDSIYLWDTRDLKKPAASFTVLAGSNQAKWSRQQEHIIASAHDGDVRVWDARKPNLAVQYIAAHLSKVHGLDWSPSQGSCFATTSQDSSLKIWDFTDPGKPCDQLSLPSPAWKIRYTPLSNGFVTVPVPQVGRQGPQLFLWRAWDLSQPVQTLHGHSNIVMDVCWAPESRPSPSNYTLFTVAKDQTLRRWLVDANLLSNRAREQSMDDMRALAKELEDANVSDRLQSFVVEPSLDIQQEFAALNAIVGLHIDEMDYDRAVVTVSFRGQTHLVKLSINFPSDFPQNNRISFHFCPETTLSPNARLSLLKRLQELCKEARRPVVASSLETFVEKVDEIPSLGSEESEGAESPRPSSNPMLQSPSVGFLDPRVPFPRTSGGRFNSVGTLVCFGRMELSHLGEADQSSRTPRSLHALSNLSQPVKSYFSARRTEFTVKDFYLEAPMDSSRVSKDPELRRFSHVYVYDCEKLLPICKELAKRYKLSGSAEAATVCEDNAKAAASCGRPDLVQTWHLLAHCLTANADGGTDSDAPWAVSPFGRPLVHSLLDHYGRIGDIQTVATVSCVLNAGVRDSLRSSSLSSSTGTVSPYNTVHGNGTLPQILMQRQRSSSFDAPTLAPTSPSSPPAPELDDQIKIFSIDLEVSERTQLLDIEILRRLEGVKQMYADALYRWGLINESSAILKYSLLPPERHLGPGTEVVVTICHKCGEWDKTGAQCLDCQAVAFRCCICSLSVKGLGSACPSCGHGGHSQHLHDWFRIYSLCPAAGCGCPCTLV